MTNSAQYANFSHVTNNKQISDQHADVSSGDGAAVQRRQPDIDSQHPEVHQPAGQGSRSTLEGARQRGHSQLRRQHHQSSILLMIHLTAIMHYFCACKIFAILFVEFFINLYCKNASTIFEVLIANY